MRLEEMEVMVVHKLDGKGTAFAVTNDNENVFIL